MSYEKTTWVDHIVDPETGEVIQEGTRFTEARGNKIEQGIFDNDARSTENENKINNSFYADIDTYYGNTKLIDDFNDVSGWITFGGTLTADTTNVKIGKQSHRLTENDNTGGAVYSQKDNVSIDLSKFNNGEVSTEDNDYINIVLYVSDASKISALYIGLDNSPTYNEINCKRLLINIGSLVNGWNFIKFKKSAATSYGTGVWSNIQSIRVLWTSLANSQNAFVSFQLIQLVKKDPLEDYPNPFQKFGVRDFSITNGEWVVGLEFGRPVIKEIALLSTASLGLRCEQVGTSNFNMQSVEKSSEELARPLTFWIDDSNYILVILDAGLVSLVKNETGVSQTINANLVITANDIISTSLIKSGNEVQLVVVKNYNYCNPTIINTTFAPTQIGTLGVGIVSGSYTYVYSASVTEIAHAHHAVIAEIAKGLVEQPKCRLKSGSSQSIQNSLYVNVLFQAAVYDNRRHFDVNASLSRMNCRENGHYSIFGGIEFSAGSQSFVDVYIMLNSATLLQCQRETNLSPTLNARLSVYTEYDLKVGDYVELVVLHNASGAINVGFSGEQYPCLGFSKMF